MTYSKETFWKLGEWSLQWRRSGIRTQWSATLKLRRNSKRIRWRSLRSMKKYLALWRKWVKEWQKKKWIGVVSVGRPMQTSRTPCLLHATVQAQWGSFTLSVWGTGWTLRNRWRIALTSHPTTGKPLNAKYARRLTLVWFSTLFNPSIVVIRSDGRTYNLVDYERPEGDFLVLESLNQEKNTSRIIHIIRPNDKKDSFKLGRGHESDLRINDISVSRCHAIIKLKEGKF